MVNVVIDFNLINEFILGDFFLKVFMLLNSNFIIFSLFSYLVFWIVLNKKVYCYYFKVFI